MTLRQRLKCTHFFEFGKKTVASSGIKVALNLGYPYLRYQYAMHKIVLARTPMLTPFRGILVGRAIVASKGVSILDGGVTKPVYFVKAKPIDRGLTFVFALSGGRVSTGVFIAPLSRGLAKFKSNTGISSVLFTARKGIKRDTPYTFLSPLIKRGLGIRSMTNALSPVPGLILPSLSTVESHVIRDSLQYGGKAKVVIDSKGLVGVRGGGGEGEDIFWNVCFDKGRLKSFVSWFLRIYGEYKTIQLVEQLKNVGFEYATKAGISLGIEDLKIPPRKADLILEAEKLTKVTVTQYNRGEISGVERFQRLIDTWHRTSELLKQEVIDHFEATDILNPVYMMAFSGARGNISQVRQLVGMRGLMADPQGQIIDFPIRSNFREGLTLTEYIISSYGARKGIVDTALRTANAGYLTRRLVDVAQHVVVSQYDCGTNRGLFLTEMKESNKIIYSLQNRLLGRVLAKDIYKSVGCVSEYQGIFSSEKIAFRNQEVSADLAFTISKNCTKVFVRSSLTCETKKLVCQLCYGWSLAQGSLVSIGEAVGIVAAQSIGEPGTQLTMRTFHTGGVFSGDVSEQIRAPYNGYVQYSSSIAGTLIRTAEGQIAFLTKNEAMLFVLKVSHPIKIFNPLILMNANDTTNNLPVVPTINTKEIRKYKIPAYTVLFIRNNENVFEKQVIAQISSISRQKNIRDDAELTIKAEMEGQFYSKTLSLQQKLVGPKLKKPTEKDLHTLLDPILEARDWSFAWILSGKIYELPMPTSFFPQQGDFINTSCTVNQTRWLLASHGGMISYLYVSNFELNKKRKIALDLPCREAKYPSLPTFGRGIKDQLQKTNNDRLQKLGDLEKGEDNKLTFRTPAVQFLSLRAKLNSGNKKVAQPGGGMTPLFQIPITFNCVKQQGRVVPTAGRDPKVAFKSHTMQVKNSRSFTGGIRKAHPSFIKKPVFFLNIKKIQYQNIGYVLHIPPSSNFVSPSPVLTPSSLIKSNDFIFTAHALQPKGNQSTLQNYQSSKDNEYTWRGRTDFVASLGQSHKSLSPSISAAGESKSELFSQEFGENRVKHKSNYNGSMANNNKQTVLSLSATNWNPSMCKFIQWLPQNSSINTAGLFIFESTVKNTVPEEWLGVSKVRELKTFHKKPIPISSLSLNIKEGLERTKNKIKMKPIFMKWFKLPNISLANPTISHIKKNHYQVSYVSYKKESHWFTTNLSYNLRDLVRESAVFYSGKLLSNFAPPYHYLGFNNQKDPKTIWDLLENTKCHIGISSQNPVANNRFLSTQRFFYMSQPCYKLNTQCLRSKQDNSLRNLTLWDKDHATWLQETPMEQGNSRELETKKPLLHINKNHYNSMRAYFFCVTTFKPFYFQTKSAFSINELHLNPNQVNLGLYHGGMQNPYKASIKSSMPYYSYLSLRSNTYPHLNELEVRVSDDSNFVNSHIGNSTFDTVGSALQGGYSFTGSKGSLFSSPSKRVEKKSLKKRSRTETKVAPTLLTYLKRRPGFFNCKLVASLANDVILHNPTQLLEIPPLSPVPEDAKNTSISLTPPGTQVIAGRKAHMPLPLPSLPKRSQVNGDNIDFKLRFSKNREWLENELTAAILLGAAKQTRSDLNHHNVSLGSENGLRTQQQPVKRYLVAITYWRKWNDSLQNLLVQTLFQTNSLFIKSYPTFFYLKDKVALLDLFYSHSYLVPLSLLPQLRATYYPLTGQGPAMGLAQPSSKARKGNAIVPQVGAKSEIKHKKSISPVSLATITIVLPNKNLSNSAYLYTTCNQRLCSFLDNKMKKIPSFIDKEMHSLLPPLPLPIGLYGNVISGVPTNSDSLKKANHLYSYVTLKKGWVYKPTNMSDALKYDKKFVLAGELLLDHLIFDRFPSSAIYIECVHLKEKKTIHNLLSGFLWNKTSPTSGRHNLTLLLGKKTEHGERGLTLPKKSIYTLKTKCVVVAATYLSAGVTVETSKILSASSRQLENPSTNPKTELAWIKNMKPRFGPGEGQSIFRLSDFAKEKHNTNDDAFVLVFRKIEQYNLREPLNNKLTVQDLLLTSLQSIKIKPCLTLCSSKRIGTNLLPLPLRYHKRVNAATSLSKQTKIQIKNKVFFINKKLNSLSLQNLYRSAVFNKQLKTTEIVASLPNIDFYIEQNLLWEDLKLDKSSFSSNLTRGNPSVMLPWREQSVATGSQVGMSSLDYVLPQVGGTLSFSPEDNSGPFQLPPTLEGGPLTVGPLYNNQISKQQQSYCFAWSYRPLNFNSFTVNYKNLNFLRVTPPNASEITLKTASTLAHALPVLEPEKEAVTSLRSNQGAHILFNYKKQAPFHVFVYKTSIKNTPNWQCFSTLLKKLIQTGFLILKKQMLCHSLAYSIRRNPPSPPDKSTVGGYIPCNTVVVPKLLPTVEQVRLEKTKLNLRKLRLKKDTLSSIQSIIPILFDSPCLDLNIKSTLLVNKNGFFASKSINCSTTEGSALSKKKELSKTKFYANLGNNLICSTPVAQTSFFSAFEGELLTFSQPKLKRNPLLQSLKRGDALLPTVGGPDFPVVNAMLPVSTWDTKVVGSSLSKITEKQVYFGLANFTSNPNSNKNLLSETKDLVLELPTKPMSHPFDKTEKKEIGSFPVFANSCLVLTKKDLISFSSVFIQSSSTLEGIEQQQGEKKSKRLRLGDFYLHGDLLESLDTPNKPSGFNVSGQIVHLSTSRQSSIKSPAQHLNMLSPAAGFSAVELLSPVVVGTTTVIVPKISKGDTQTLLNIKKYHNGCSSFSLQNSEPTYPFFIKALSKSSHVGTHSIGVPTVSMQNRDLQEPTFSLTPTIVLPLLSQAMGGNKDRDKTAITHLQGGLPEVNVVPKETVESEKDNKYLRYKSVNTHQVKTIITLRRAQPIFISPKGVFHVHEGDFIQNKAPVITLAYQRLKTGDIIEGIPKVEQFFEARTTKRGRLFKDSLPNLLKGLFGRYRKKSIKNYFPKRVRDNNSNLSFDSQSRSVTNGATRKARELHKTLGLDQAVRQSFYKIQQIIVDGVQRVYRSQGAAIADKHLEVIVRQMTSKVQIVKGGQTGFFPGELVDFEFIGDVNTMLLVKVQYQPVVVGITRASLQVNSFLAAASFQQTTRILSEAAINKRQDFLKGLKENVMLGNLIPAGTGYLVYLDF